MCEHITAVNIPTGSTPVHSKECCFCYNGVETAALPPQSTAPDNTFSMSTLLATKPNFPKVGHNVCLTCFTGGCGPSHAHALRHWDVTKHNIILNLQYEYPEKDIVIAAMASGQPTPEPKCTPTTYCIQCDVTVSNNSTDKLQQAISGVLSLQDALKLKEFDNKAAQTGTSTMSDPFSGGVSCTHCDDTLESAQQEQCLANLELELQSEEGPDGTSRTYINHTYTDINGTAVTRRIWLGENYLPDLSLASKPLDEKELSRAEQQYPPTSDGSNSFNKYQCRDCDIATNLWMCMTCGCFGCARKDYDGSGGNNHAVEHNKATGHPLVIKIATVSANSGDIWCYSCDDSVSAKDLKTHLMAFNLDIEKLTKSEKSLEDMQLELNTAAQFASAFNRDGFSKPLLFGKGLTGMANFGNSCYMGSVMQLYFRIPNIYERYYNEGAKHVATCRNGRPGTCVLCQFFKLTQGLFSGEFSPIPSDQLAMRYVQSVFPGIVNQRIRRAHGGMMVDLSENGAPKRSNTEMNDAYTGGTISSEAKKQRVGDVTNTNTGLVSLDDTNEQQQQQQQQQETPTPSITLQNGISIHSIRKLLNDNHPEFGNLRQQDAHEYLVHLRDYTHNFEKTRCPQASKINPDTTPSINDAFAFKTQQVISCKSCGETHSKYSDHLDFQLELTQPVEIVDPESTPSAEMTDVATATGPTPETKTEKDKKYQPQQFSNCLKTFADEQTLVGFRCPNAACGVMSQCTSKNTIFTLPEYLTVQVKRFIVDTTTWSFTKNNAPLQGTENISLDAILTKTAPDLTKPASFTAAGNAADERYLANAELMQEMLMSPICVAVELLKKCNNDVDTATEQFFSLEDGSEHKMGCSCPGQSPAVAQPQAGAAAAAAAVAANVDDPIIKTTGKLDIGIFDTSTRQLRSDLKSNYRLVGFINHLGPSARAGHYVSHVLAKWNSERCLNPQQKPDQRATPTLFSTLNYPHNEAPTKEDDIKPCFRPFDGAGATDGADWICYNDDKVFVNDEPPNDQAYVLLFQRID